jgi:hypothetical protein
MGDGDSNRKKEEKWALKIKKDAMSPETKMRKM